MTDSDRMLVLSAEAELSVIRVLADHAALSSVAQERIHDALKVIRSALDVRRNEVGLQRRGLPVTA